MKKTILAFDPGVKNTGWCLYTSENDYECGTLNTESFSQMKDAIVELMKDEWPNCDAQVAVEDFTFQGWRKTKSGDYRAIPFGSQTAHLVGFIEGLSSGRFIGCFEAKDTKANMGWLRKDFKNEHEYSAYCVAHFAAGIEKLEK